MTTSPHSVMSDKERIRRLRYWLGEIMQVARITAGGEFYVMLAEKALSYTRPMGDVDGPGGDAGPKSTA